MRPSAAAAVALPKQHVFFLSHMRAYSSLLGHIMGSHPQICGYYEMHIGYHGWKSLVRQKLLYFQEEDAKPNLRYMFDKVLHDDHHVAPQVLESPRVSALFSLRHPAQAIPSINALYRKEEPGHEFTEPEFATRYYIDRARSLADMAAGMTRDYLYMDAETITTRTDECLNLLTNWLNLSTPLDSNYQVQKKTAVGKFGDTSDRLRSGGIERVKASSNARGNADPLDPALLDEALAVYTLCRQKMADGAAAQCLLGAA